MGVASAANVILVLSYKDVVMKKVSGLILAVGVVAVLSGCGTAAATTTPPPATKTAAASADPVAATPTATTKLPGCATLVAQANDPLAMTYLADACVLSTGTVSLTGDATTSDGRFVDYGTLKIQLAKVQRMPNADGSDLNGMGTLRTSYALVRVDLTVTDKGTTPFSLASLTDQNGTFEIMYGNGQTAANNSGTIDMNSTNIRPLILQDNPPTVVPVGGHVDLYTSFNVPVTGLSTMSVAVDPDPSVGYTPYRMTNAAKIMTVFKP